MGLPNATGAGAPKPLGCPPNGDGFDCANEPKPDAPDEPKPEVAPEPKVCPEGLGADMLLTPPPNVEGCPKPPGLCPNGLADEPIVDA